MKTQIGIAMLTVISLSIVAMAYSGAMPSGISYVNSVPLNATPVQNASVANLAYNNLYGVTTYYCQGLCNQAPLIEQYNITSVQAENMTVPDSAVLTSFWNANLVWYQPGGMPVYYYVS